MCSLLRNTFNLYSPDTAKRARFAEDDEDEDDIEEFESMGAETPASVRYLLIASILIDLNVVI